MGRCVATDMQPLATVACCVWWVDGPHMEFQHSPPGSVSCKSSIHGNYKRALRVLGLFAASTCHLVGAMRIGLPCMVTRYEVDPAKNGLRLGQAARDEDSVRSASDGRM